MTEIEKLVAFSRALREHNVLVTPAEVVAATTALRLIDADDRDEVFLSLRCVLTSRFDDFPIFDELFQQFWYSTPTKLVERESSSHNSARVRSHSAKSHSTGIAYFLEHWTSAGGDEQREVSLRSASNIESTAQKDFTAFGNDELNQISQLARRLVKRLAKNRSRRWQPIRRGSRISLRRSFRQSLKSGGELIDLAYQKRRRKKTKLVVICDISGSMDIYSRVLLQFVYGLQNTFAKVETFVFSTSLTRITGHLKNKTYQRALEHLSSRVAGWSGGTRIGESLRSFNSEWIRRIDKRTILIILSDGWDTGEPEQLAAELAQLQKRAGRLIWLNPLLGSSTYQPLTRGMQAALPFINVFAPAHDLASLRALEPHLVL